MKKVLSILLIFTLALSLVACGGTDPESDSVESSDVSSEQIIYEDEYIKATYLGITDTIMTVSLENKSNEEITVLPMDSYVDGTMTQFTSGMLATIQPGKTFNQGWLLGATPEEEIGFTLSICGEDMSELVRTDTLKVEIK